MLTTRNFRHISLGKEGAPSVTRVLLGAVALWATEAPSEMCALTQKDQIHSREPNTEAHDPHKQIRSQSDQTRTSC
jgi:hypothetical protein